MWSGRCHVAGHPPNIPPDTFSIKLNFFSEAACVRMSLSQPAPPAPHTRGPNLIWTYAGSIWTYKSDKPYYVKSIMVTYQWLSIPHYLTVALCWLIRLVNNVHEHCSPFRARGCAAIGVCVSALSPHLTPPPTPITTPSHPSSTRHSKSRHALT